jgi:hypothetical protein
MKYQIPITGSLIFLSAITPALCSNFTGRVVQLDLIFPRPFGVYKPVYPFPIVFSISNATSIQLYQRSFQWDLSGFNNYNRLADSVTDSGGFTIDSESLQTQSPSTQDQLLLIYNTSIIVNTTKNTFLVGGFLSVGDCHISPDAENFLILDNSTWFNISDAGELPDILAGGDCATPLGAIGVGPAIQSDPTCPNYSDPNPTPVSCATPVNSTVADAVAKAMLEASNCNGTGMAWPNASLVNNCPRRNAARIYVPGVYTMIMPTLLGLLILLI